MVMHDMFHFDYVTNNFVHVQCSKQSMEMTFSHTTFMISNKVFFFHLDSKPLSKLYKNGVRVLNRELKSNIDLSKFELEGRYVENKNVSSASYIQVWLRSLVEQTYVLGTVIIHF